jgi:hypothetical protein
VMPCRAEVIMVPFPLTKERLITRPHLRILHRKISLLVIFVVSARQNYADPIAWATNRNIEPHGDPVSGMLQRLRMAMNGCLHPLPLVSQ